MNNGNNSAGFSADLSLPHFVHKWTADPVTTSRVSAVNEGCGTASTQPLIANSNSGSTLAPSSTAQPGNYVENFSGDRIFSRSLSVNDGQEYTEMLMPQVMSASSTSGVTIKREPLFESSTDEGGLQPAVKVKGRSIFLSIKLNK